MMTNRRAFLIGSIAALAAPAVIRIPRLLMPIKPVPIVPRAFRYSPTVGIYEVIDHRVTLIKTGPWMASLVAEAREKMGEDSFVSTIVLLAQEKGMVPT